MKPKTLPPKPKPKPLTLTPEETERVNRARQKAEAQALEPEWLFIAEFGYHFGWHGVTAILNNDIDFDTAAALTRGAKKIWYQKLIDTASANTASYIAANSKTPQATLKKGLDKFIKEAV